MNTNDITVVVTTAPRIECYLEDTLNSIDACGWKPMIFAEPGSTKTRFPSIEWTTRQGLWWNWKLASQWAIEQNTRYIMTVQDDCLFHPDTKKVLDRLPELPNMGYLSLYTPAHYQEDQDGNPIKGLYTVAVSSAWGALSLIFERETLIKVLQDDRAKNWIGIKPKDASSNWREEQASHPERIKNSDYIIGSILSYTLAKNLYYLSPSPCFHSAKYSSVGHSGNSGNRNAKYAADHSQPLFPQIFENDLSISKIGDLRISKSNSKNSVYYHSESMQSMFRK